MYDESLSCYEDLVLFHQLFSKCSKVVWNGKPLYHYIMETLLNVPALVSKRVYKDKMSFEQANSIILEGMGSQFDPALKEAYLAARPALEAYYSNLET